MLTLGSAKVAIKDAAHQVLVARWNALLFDRAIGASHGVTDVIDYGRFGLRAASGFVGIKPLCDRAFIRGIWVACVEGLGLGPTG